MLLISFVFFGVSKISTEQLKNQETCFQIKLTSIEKGMSKCFALKNYNTYNSIPYLIIFRDNGITIQIMNYQVYTELSIFLGVTITRLLPIQKNMAQNIVGICATFAIFVIQPLFYLNGDVNFRKRVQNQGLWKALKRELFQSNYHIQPVP
jgi:hypothetical protein